MQKYISQRDEHDVMHRSPTLSALSDSDDHEELWKFVSCALVQLIVQV